MSLKLPSNNELILFRKRKEPCLGIFSEATGSKYTLFSEEGKDINIDPQKVVYVSGIKIEGDFTPAEKKLKLREFRNHLETEKDNIDLETIWSCLEPCDDELKMEELFELYLGDDTSDNDELLTLFWAIDKNDIYIKRGGAGYELRSQEDVEKLLKKKEAEIKKKDERKSALFWAKGIINGKYDPSANADFDPSGYIELLRNYVVFLDKFNRTTEVKSFLSEVGIKDVEGAIEFLIKAGAWGQDEEPLIKRFSIREDFPEKVNDELADILNEEFSDDLLEDLTHLEIYSVDDENTEDIDDAVSIEETTDGISIGVHIANVAAYVRKWSALDDEAARRGETIYLPEKRIHMFPPDLIKEKLSLIENTPRKALSLIAQYDNEYNLKKFTFVNSKINVKKNITYAEAKDYLDNDPRWIKLRDLAQKLRQDRLDAGALIIQLPQLKIRIGENSQIIIEKNYMKTVGHRVIAELMILMNTLAGKFLKERELPAIYRSQPEPISEDARDHDESNPLYPTRVVKYLRAPKVGLTPEPHRSLGLEVYTQVTSPIRRYADLVMQRQIVSELESNEPCYSDDEIENLYPKIDIGIRDKRTVEKSREKYWLYKYLEQHKGEVIEGVISSIANSRASVYIPDYLFEMQIQVGAYNVTEEGENIKLVIQNVDPLRRKLTLRPVLT